MKYRSAILDAIDIVKKYSNNEQKKRYGKYV